MKGKSEPKERAAVIFASLVQKCDDEHQDCMGNYFKPVRKSSCGGFEKALLYWRKGLCALFSCTSFFTYNSILFLITRVSHTISMIFLWGVELTSINDVFK